MGWRRKSEVGSQKKKQSLNFRLQTSDFGLRTSDFRLQTMELLITIFSDEQSFGHYSFIDFVFAYAGTDTCWIMVRPPYI